MAVCEDIPGFLLEATLRTKSMLGGLVMNQSITDTTTGQRRFWQENNYIFGGKLENFN